MSGVENLVLTVGKVAVLLSSGALIMLMFNQFDGYSVKENEGRRRSAYKINR